MKKIRIQNIRSGMRSAADIKNHQGEILLEKGKTITKKHLQIFHMWGIVEVEIEDIPDDVLQEQEPVIDTALDEEAEKEVLKRFRLTNLDHPAMIELFKLCKEHIQSQKVR